MRLSLQAAASQPTAADAGRQLAADLPQVIHVTGDLSNADWLTRVAWRLDSLRVLI